MINAKSLLCTLFIIASILIDLVLWDLCLSSPHQSLASVMLWGCLFAQTGMVAIVAATFNESSPLSITSFIVVNLFAAVSLASITELAWLNWLGIFFCHSVIIYCVWNLVRFFTAPQQQFSLSQIFALMTLLGVLCALFPLDEFPLKHYFSLLPTIIGFSVAVLYAGVLIHFQFKGVAWKAILVFWPIAWGQMIGLLDATPGAGFFLSAIYASASIYLLLVVQLAGHLRSIQVTKQQAESNLKIYSSVEFEGK